MINNNKQIENNIKIAAVDVIHSALQIGDSLLLYILLFFLSIGGEGNEGVRRVIANKSKKLNESGKSDALEASSLEESSLSEIVNFE